MSYSEEFKHDSTMNVDENLDSKDMSQAEEDAERQEDFKDDTVMVDDLDNDRAEDIEMDTQNVIGESTAVSEDSEDGTASLADENLEVATDADVEQKEVENEIVVSESVKDKEPVDEPAETPKENDLIRTFLELCKNPKGQFSELSVFKEELLQAKRTMIHKVYAQSKRKVKAENSSQQLSGSHSQQMQTQNQQYSQAQQQLPADSGVPGFLPRPDKKRRTRAVERCSSPSHFAVPHAELQKYGPPSIKDLPARRQVDSVLQAVASMYYAPREVSADKQTVFVDALYDKTIYPTIDCLMSPLRKVDVWDLWNPREIALFECAMCSIGKDFLKISKIIQSKSVHEVVDFYYQWKKSAHYQMWKEYGRPVREIPEGRLEQWNSLKAKMAGF